VAEASDVDGTIERVTLHVDGQPVRTEYKAPYNWGALNDGGNKNELDDLGPGTHVLELEAVDDDQATSWARLEIVVE
jgi:hypothetical protein